MSVLLFLVFSYLYEQSRQPYFRAWNWRGLCTRCTTSLDTFPSSAIAFFVGELFLVAMALCIFVSTRLMRGPSHFRWYDAVVAALGIILASLTLRGHMRERRVPARRRSRLFRLGIGLAAILLYCSAVFYVNGHKRGSLAFQVLAGSLALWAVLMGVGQLHNPAVEKTSAAPAGCSARFRRCCWASPW